MSDLISRSKAIQMLIQETTDSKSNLIHINTVKRLLQDVDTAYDIDKVVAELEKAKAILANEYYCKTINDKKDCENNNCFECCANYLIEIVKQGGVSDDVCEWKFEETTGIAWHCNDKCTTYNQSYIKNLKIILEDFECKCPYCGKKIKVVE